MEKPMFETRAFNSYLNSYVALSSEKYLGIFEVIKLDERSKTLTIEYNNIPLTFNTKGECITCPKFKISVSTADNYDSYLYSLKNLEAK